MIDRHVNLRIPKELHDGLRKYAKENGKSVSSTILSACERFLELHEHGVCPSCLTPHDVSAICRQGNSPTLDQDAIAVLQSQIDELKTIIAINRADFDEFQKSIHTLIEHPDAK
jgi:hypothetical protein